MRTTLSTLVAVFAGASLAGCGSGSNEQETRREATPPAATAATTTASGPASTESRTVACQATIFDVDFVQAESVSVTSEGRSLAAASYTDRGVSTDCTSTEKPRVFAENPALEDGVYEDARLNCEAPEQIEIDVHPIVDGDNNNAVIGSNLLVFTRSSKTAEVLVSAVLKNQEQAAVASRLYYAAAYCKPAS